MLISHLFSIEGYLPKLVVTCICITNTKFFVKHQPLLADTDAKNSRNTCNSIERNFRNLEIICYVKISPIYLKNVIQAKTSCIDSPQINTA